MTPSQKTKNSRDSARFWAYATAFGALWGFCEITIGSFLMSLRLPFAGVGLAAVGAAVLVAQRQLISKPGISLATGVIAAMCKSISPGGIIIQPMVGILAESLMVELALSLVPISIVSATLGGVLAAMWSVFQQIAYLWLIYSEKLIELYVVLLQKAGRALGLGDIVGWWALAVFLSVVTLLGVAGGLLGLRLGQSAKEELHRKWSRTDLA